MHKFPVLILLVDFSRLAGELCTERGSWLTLVWLHSFETPNWAQVLPAVLALPWMWVGNWSSTAHETQLGHTCLWGTAPSTLRQTILSNKAVLWYSVEK